MASISKPITTETTSPTDTIASDDDENEIVELRDDDDNNAAWKQDEYEDLSAEEADVEGEGEISESEAEEYETVEQRHRRLQAGRRPATVTVRRGEYDGAQEDDDDEGTINGEEGVEEEDAQSAYSSSSASSEDSDDPEKVDPNVADEMEKFEATFRGFSKRFRLINKIGEG